MVADYPDPAREAVPGSEVVTGLCEAGPLVKECRSKMGGCGVVYEGQKDVGVWEGTLKCHV